MALERPYCIVSDVSSETQNSDAPDSVYEGAINLASRFIDEYCQTDFWFHDYSSTVLEVPRSWVIGERVTLPWPIITLTGLWVYSDREIGAVDDDKFDFDEYYFEVGKSKIETEGGVFGVHPFKLNMELEGTFGYPIVDNETPPATLPQSIRRACTLIAANLSGENNKQVVGLDGVVSDMLDTRIPDEAKMLLKRYRLVSNYAL